MTEKTNGEIEKLKKKVEELEKLRQEYLSGWQRARADLINYKKEELERIQDFIKKAIEKFILEFLPILDNFYNAERAISSEKKEMPEIKGILQIKKQILDFLKNYGLEEIDSVGKKFDPLFHEVVEEIEVEKFEGGTIVEEIQKGYKINGRLLRPAKVKVAKNNILSKN